MTYTCPMHPEIEQNKPGKCPKCGMALVDSSSLKLDTVDVQKSYWPLVVIIGLILLTTLTIAFKDLQLGTFSIPKTISYFMIGFFIVFAGFKLMDLKGFAEGYATYDLLAKKWPFYGYIYPFIELFFGIAMIIDFQPTLILMSELIVMTFSGLGVAIKLLKKEQFQCSCLGTFLKVPLTKITLIEDFGMAILAFILLFMNSSDLAYQSKLSTQSHRSYEIEVIKKPEANDIKLNEPVNIKFKIKNDKQEEVEDFDIAHEKLMHLIIVRKDLQKFDHLHPDFDQTSGEFSVDVNFTEDGPYRFFADFIPKEENPQKLPVAVYSDLDVGDKENYRLQEIKVDTEKAKSLLSDYKVNYDLPSEVKAQKPLEYSLNVVKNGKPVILENYLGALGHSVILKEDTLEYIHAHADAQIDSDQMNHSQLDHSMENMSQRPTNRIEFSTNLPSEGVYKIFTQFKHIEKVYTSDYVIRVS
jgi:hypothetical protein